jgi:hypothetical protein
MSITTTRLAASGQPTSAIQGRSYSRGLDDLGPGGRGAGDQRLAPGRRRSRRRGHPPHRRRAAPGAGCAEPSRRGRSPLALPQWAGGDRRDRVGHSAVCRDCARANLSTDGTLYTCLFPPPATTCGCCYARAPATTISARRWPGSGGGRGDRDSELRAACRSGRLDRGCGRGRPGRPAGRSPRSSMVHRSPPHRSSVAGRAPPNSSEHTTTAVRPTRLTPSAATPPRLPTPAVSSPKPHPCDDSTLPAAGKATAGPSWAGGLGSPCLQIRAYGSRATPPAGSSAPSIPHGHSWAAA